VGAAHMVVAVVVVARTAAATNTQFSSFSLLTQTAPIPQTVTKQGL
jgi:hypothetical protein